jgi:phage protein D
VDDTNGQIVFPQKGAPMIIALGWADGGVRVVFTGTVDEVKSSGSRGSGRVMTISAKGMDTTGKPKEHQHRHWDDAKLPQILGDAGKHAGVTSVQVDPALAGKARKYFEMRDESFVAMGERLAREVGGNFRIVGSTAYLTRRNGIYAGVTRAVWGDNLHSWDISPQLGRPQFSSVVARYYDMAKAQTMETGSSTSLEADARHATRHFKPDPNEAGQQNGADTATSESEAGGGSVTIEGNTAAVPDGVCIVAGCRPGVDGAYRIEGVTHTYSRSGFTSSLELKFPQ